MGQAKKRGTFEQRQQVAYDKIDAQAGLLKQARENELELERIEREAEAMAHTNAAQLVTAYWQFSGIGQRVRSSSYIDPAVVTAFKEGVDIPSAAE